MDRRDRSRKCGDPQTVWAEYQKGLSFKQGLNLFDSVKSNEDFYVGKQWEGVQSNGLPTPVFNFIRRIVLFLVASVATDNLKINASPLASTSVADEGALETLCSVVNDQFEAIVEQAKLGKLIRELMRAAAVDGDTCVYSWFDAEAETGQTAKGTIRAELLENIRVTFGNPNSRDVQSQPYIIISRREQLEAVKEEAEAYGEDPDLVRDDTDEAGDRFDALAEGKTTTLLKFWKNKETGTVWAVKTVNGAVVRKAWDTQQQLYPIAWLSWEKVNNCYHGQAAVTGLIPNQVFVNKMFAMVMISLMTTAYPKVIYDQSCIAKWDSGVGKAIGVKDLRGRSIRDIAQVMDPAAISPQVTQFIELAIGITKECMGATDAAMGNTKPDNTSAIIALQKASQVPMELIKQDLHQMLEDVANVWLDLMRAYYGQRLVVVPMTKDEKALESMGVPVPREPRLFDFGQLAAHPLSLKLDVGGSPYWSEIAQINTLDNLLINGQITVVDYLERVPADLITNQQELIEAIKQRQGMTPAGGNVGAGDPLQDMDPATDPALIAGEQTLQRKLAEQGAPGMY